MAGLIKSQLFKHLAKFFKDLSTDSFNLSTIKGTCDLHDLKLNEEVLMDLIELPVWLNISKATCTHATIKIPWTRLKSVPIELNLDEVSVDIETCENFRKMKNSSTSHLNQPHKYGWIDKILDGITIHINSVVISFKSSAFKASLNLSVLTVESRAPTWKKTNLQWTYVKDSKTGLIVNFKHIEWHAFKFEAKSESKIGSSPLRLITSQGSCKIKIRKRLSDCQVIGARIIVAFDDLLWVLNDHIVVSAIHLVRYINDLIIRAPLTKRIIDVTSPTKVRQDKNKNIDLNIFSFETSYHLTINCLQLHICDDFDKDCQSSYPLLKDGGSMYIVLNKLVFDFYPYHKATGSRKNWLHYDDPGSSKEKWVSQYLFTYLAEKMRTDQEFSKNFSCNMPQNPLADLFSNVILIRLGNYQINCCQVSTDVKGRKFGDKSKDFLTIGQFPNDLPALYFEINQYYYYEFGSARINNFKQLPDPTLFVNCAPFILNFDVITLLWLNAFHAHLHKSLMELTELIPQNSSTTNIISRIEIFLPKIVIGLDDMPNCDKNEKKLELSCSQFVIENDFCGKTKDYLARFSANVEDYVLFKEKNKFPWVSNEIDRTPNKEMAFKNDGLSWIMSADAVWFKFVGTKNLYETTLLDPCEIKILSYYFNDIINIMIDIDSIIKVKIDKEGFLFFKRLIEKLDDFDLCLVNDTYNIQQKLGELFEPTKLSIFSLVNTVDLEIILDRKLIQNISEIQSQASCLSANEIVKDTKNKTTKEPINEEILDGSKFNSENTYTLPSQFVPKVIDIPNRGDSISDSVIDRSESLSTFGDMPDLSINDDERSLRSDFSEEDDLAGFTHLTLEEDESFFANKAEVEEAIDAFSLCQPKIHNKPQIVSISLIHICFNKLGIVKQASGFHSSFFMNSKMGLKDYIGISSEEYKSLKIIEDTNATLSMRFDIILSPHKRDDLVSLQIEDLNTSLNNDSLTLISDFIFDPNDESPAVSPALILLKNFRVKLVDERLKTPPLIINLEKIIIKRSNDNILELKEITTKDSFSALARSHAIMLSAHISSIRKDPLCWSDSNSIESENERLKNELRLLEEKYKSLKNMLGKE